MRSTIHAVTLWLLFTALDHPCSTAYAQGSAFSYQGRLTDGGTPAEGLYDFRFRLAADPLGNTYFGSDFLTNAIPVINGLFNTTMDFGPGLFTGNNYWLEVDVRTNGGSTYTALTPLQAILPTPYAMFADTASNVNGTISSASITGTYGNALTLSNANNSINGTFAGDGTAMINVNAVTLNGLRATNFWQTGGNSGTTAGVNYLGTADNQPLELHVNGTRALRLEPIHVGLNIVPNIIGGAPNNVVDTGAFGAFIGGGGAQSVYTNEVTGNFGSLVGGAQNTAGDAAFIGGGAFNLATNHYSVVVGGFQNNAYGIGSFVGGGGYDGTYENHNVNGGNGAVIVGGLGNAISPGDTYSFIGGGANNVISGGAPTVVIGGGAGNIVYGDLYGYGTQVIGGGYQNIIYSNSWNSSIVGGAGNRVGTNSSYSTIGGGGGNSVGTGAYDSFIGGGNANSVGEGSYNSVIGGGGGNTIQIGAPGGVIAGGGQNTIQTNASNSFIGGGYNDAIQINANNSVIGGGAGNQIESNAIASVIAGGAFNGMLPNSQFSVISGGENNYIYSDAACGTIGGGLYNAIGVGATNTTIGGGFNNAVFAPFGTVPGGYRNIAAGEFSFAAGQQAFANNPGAFVWADSQNASFSSWGNDQFCIRAQGGVQLDPGTSVYCGYQVRQMLNLWGTGYGIGVQASDEYFRTAGQFYWFLGGTHNDDNGNSGGGTTMMSLTSSGLTVNGTFVSTSDRNLKEHFHAVNQREVLQKVAALPVSQWNYKDDAGTKHIGPMAQDFYAAFGVGPDDKHITTVDEGGVALAAIQGLNQRLDEQKAENAELKQQLADLKALIQTLVRPTPK